MAQSIKRAIPPPPGIGRAFVILSVPAVGICQKTSSRGRGILLEAVNVVPFSIFHFKKLLPAIVIGSHMGENNQCIV